jgi:hypothetical protein
MPAPAINILEHESRWSARLFTCLQEMALSNTNAVLLVLGDIDRLETGRHYPETGLVFAASHWRTYYHCHDIPSGHADEHGHFHIFTDTGGQAWAHLAGLAMDASGQPLRWLAVNHWVTGGPWLERSDLFHHLRTANAGDEDSMAGRWLYAMLQLYRSTLAELLEQRDAEISRHARVRDRKTVLEDRAIYTLATQPVKLQSMLENHLLQQAVGRPDTHGC